MKPSENSSTMALHSSCDRTGCMLLLLMGSVSTGIDAVDVLGADTIHTSIDQGVHF